MKSKEFNVFRKEKWKWNIYNEGFKGFYYLSELRISFFYGVDILAESSAIFCIFCVKSVFQCN